jgi:FAD/FMN-containing dehydrogenase
LVAGFDPVSRRWVTQAEASECGTFADAPSLDGTLHLDDATRRADSRDQGNLIERQPCAVLRPGSVEDIQKMIAFCRHHRIKVAARGQAHTTHGQGLVRGMIIENRSLNRIHSIGPEGADVDAGVLWRELIEAAYEQGLTPPAITGYTKLSIAGTLSVGGVGAISTTRAGAQVDRVGALEVVTGTGARRLCSPTQNPQLFEVLLGGLGQCGVITRAHVDLVPAKQMARTYNLDYTDNTTFFRDFRTLLYRGELDAVYNLWFPFGTSLVYQIQATVFFVPASSCSSRSSVPR